MKHEIVFLQRPTLVKDSSGQEFRVSGSIEHYFHFLLGYLLPSVYLVKKRRLHRVVVSDCGPLMNRVMSDVLREVGVAYEYVGESLPEKSFFLPAWDSSAQMGEGLFHAAATLEEIALRKQDCCVPPPDGSARLLLDRMPPIDFYSENGAAEKKGYGRSRRFIPNLKTVSFKLKALGVNHRLYAPGYHSIWCQIRHFSRASHIAGVRGAEWANLAWAKPGVRLRVLYPKHQANSLLTNYIRALGLDCELKYVDTTTPRESALELIGFFVGLDIGCRSGNRLC